MPGDTLLYTVTVTNTGDVAINNTTLQTVFPNTVGEEIEYWSESGYNPVAYVGGQVYIENQNLYGVGSSGLSFTLGSNSGTLTPGESVQVQYAIYQTGEYDSTPIINNNVGNGFYVNNSLIPNIDTNVNGYTIYNNIDYNNNYGTYSRYISNPYALNGVTEDGFIINNNATVWGTPAGSSTPVEVTGNTITSTISDPIFTINNPSIVESSSPGNLTFTVDMSESISETTAVSYTTYDNTALNGTNYTVTSGTLVFNPGQTSETISVPIIGGVSMSAPLSFLMQLSIPYGDIGQVVPDPINPTIHPVEYDFTALGIGIGTILPANSPDVVVYQTLTNMSENAVQEYLGSTATPEQILQDVPVGFIANFPNDEFQVFVQVTNNGTAQSGLVLTDVLPSGFDYIPGTLQVVSGPNAGAQSDTVGIDEASYNSNTHTITFELGSGATPEAGGSLADGASTSVAFFVRADPSLVSGASVPNTLHLATSAASVSSNIVTTAFVTPSTEPDTYNLPYLTKIVSPVPLEPLLQTSPIRKAPTCRETPCSSLIPYNLIIATCMDRLSITFLATPLMWRIRCI